MLPTTVRICGLLRHFKLFVIIFALEGSPPLSVSFQARLVYNVPSAEHDEDFDIVSGDLGPPQLLFDSDLRLPSSLQALRRYPCARRFTIVLGNPSLDAGRALAFYEDTGTFPLMVT